MTATIAPAHDFDDSKRDGSVVDAGNLNAGAGGHNDEDSVANDIEDAKLLRKVDKQ